MIVNINQRCENLRDGYRPNVGIIVCNSSHQVLWARRSNHDGWQFPQGGIEPKETVLEAAYRELNEEIGINPEQVKLAGFTPRWLRYDLPTRLRANHLRRNTIKGQKQIWMLFKFLGDDEDVSLDHSIKPEFDKWKWVDYWSPAKNIVSFKRNVYLRALAELEPYLHHF